MRRIAIMLVIFLLLGAVVTVGAAWGCAAWSRPPYRSVTIYTEHPMALIEPSGEIVEMEDHVKSLERVRSRWNKLGLRGVNVPHDRLFLNILRSPGLERRAWREWVLGSADRLVYVETRPGWPATGLWCGQGEYQVRRPAQNRWRYFGGIGLEVSAVPGQPRDDRALPLRPIFPGFLINTLFYAVILWLFWSAPFAARRLTRKQRGRCVKCGYDLSHAEHDVCPECGR